MKIKCPACSQVLSIPDSAAGKIVKCPCGKQLRAPGGAASGAPAPASGASNAPRPQATRPPGAAGASAARRSPGQPGMGAGDFDPAMFDELTADDLKPVKSAANPYAPVSAPAAGPGMLMKQYAPTGAQGGQREIAGVGSRIVGAILDGLFIMLFFFIGGGVVFAMAAASGEEISDGMGIVAIAIMVVCALIPYIINCILIAKSGQSLGKKLAGTRMVDQRTFVPVGFVQGYLVRSFAFGLITGLPLVGPIVAIADIIYLFIDNHQTLHDKLAQTVVVKA